MLKQTRYDFFLIFFFFIYPHCKVKVCTPKFPNRLVPKRNMFHWAADQLLFSLGFFIHVAGVPGWVLFCPCGRCSRLGAFVVPVAGISSWVLFCPCLWHESQARYFFCPCGRSPRLDTFFLSLWQESQAGYIFCPCGRSPKLGTFFVPVAGVPGWVHFLSLWQESQAGYIFCPCTRSSRPGTFLFLWHESQAGYFLGPMAESQAGYFFSPVPGVPGWVLLHRM